MDNYTSSATESRRGTYSEAGTLPIGTLPEGNTIIEENLTWDRSEEKKLSGSEESQHGVGMIEGEGMCGCCQPILKSNNALPPDPTRKERMKYALSCPPHGTIGRILTYLFAFVLVWGSLVALLKKDALPEGNIFSLLVIFVLANVGGHISSMMKLPPLLGMLIMGILLKSIPTIDIIGNNVSDGWSYGLRNFALTVILIRAGLGLDPVALRQLSMVVFRLAFTPCLIETFTVALVSHIVLGFPWLWGFMLGFIQAAVSPAVVVPCLLTLSDQGYGLDKGIPTLVIAAASLDDVLAISGFTVMLGVTFSKGSLVWKILQGPFDVLLGMGYGILVGLLCWLLPYRHEASLVSHRFIILLSGGLLILFGSANIGFKGAGALGVLVMAFVAGVGWRRQGWSNDENPVADHFNTAWKLLQPFLFALIGTEIDLATIDPSTVGWGIVILTCGVVLRIIASFFVVMGGNLNVKERFFVALAWFPKATVQAAIGSIALDEVRRTMRDSEDFEAWELLGKQVVTIAVLVILITAPIGAAAIMLSAPKLLNRTLPPGISPEENEPEASV